MLAAAGVISLKILSIHLLFQQGMLLGWFRIGAANMFDWLMGPKVSRYVQKPLWDCLPCMSSVWTIIFTLSFDINLMLVVCGINFIIDQFTQDERVVD